MDADLDRSAVGQVGISHAEELMAGLARSVAEDDVGYQLALKQSRDLSKHTIALKDNELDELRRLLSAKERECDTLRHTSATKTTSLEARVRDLEGQMTTQTAEIDALRTALTNARQDLVSAHTRYETEHQRAKAEHAQVKHLTAQLDNERKEVVRLDKIARDNHGANARLEAAVGEIHRVNALLTRAEEDRDVSENERRGLAEQLRNLEQSADEARMILSQLRQAFALEEYKRRQAVSKLHAERKARGVEREHMMSNMKRKLDGEKQSRKALQRWLEGELAARQESQVILSTLRDMALARPSKNLEVPEVLRMVRRIEDRLDVEELTRPVPGSVVNKAMKAKLSDAHSDVLREEIAGLKRMLVERLTVG